MKREDFCFCIGFNGDQALVDKKSRARYGKMSVDDLLSEGLFKAALCAAIYDNDENALSSVYKEYNRKASTPLKDPEDLKKVYGVYHIPQGIKSIKAV